MYFSPKNRTDILSELQLIHWLWPTLSRWAWRSHCAPDPVPALVAEAEEGTVLGSGRPTLFCHGGKGQEWEQRAWLLPGQNRKKGKGADFVLSSLLACCQLSGCHQDGLGCFPGCAPLFWGLGKKIKPQANPHQHCWANELQFMGKPSSAKDSYC